LRAVFDLILNFFGYKVLLLVLSYLGVAILILKLKRKNVLTTRDGFYWKILLRNPTDCVSAKVTK